MILVTGAKGMVGSEIVQLLSQQGVAARALFRDPWKGKELPGITWVAGDLSKPETLTTAFAGAQTLFGCVAGITLGQEEAQLSLSSGGYTEEAFDKLRLPH